MGKLALVLVLLFFSSVDGLVTEEDRILRGEVVLLEEDTRDYSKTQV